VFLDFSVRYKLIVSVIFLVLAGSFETLFHFLFVLTVTGMMLVTEILTTAGYTQEVMSATPDGEQHRFRRGHKSIDLSLTRGGQSGLVELRLKQLQERL